jgi:non-specific serine/threonine protein kinase
VDQGVDRLVYECGSLRIDPANRRLTRGGSDIALEPKAFAVLLVLLERADDLVTREELLDAVWGHRYVTPATLNRVMAVLRRALQDDADHPRLIQTVHGAGYRFIEAVRTISGSAGEPRAHFGPPSVAQLPAKLEALVGREGDLDRLSALLSQHRAVTIIGPGGMGKTQCALEAARLCGDRFPDGVWFFDLSPLGRAQEWLTALAGALSVPTAGAQPLLPRVVKALAQRQCLLVIDNCDRLASEIGSIVFGLLRGCALLKVLATSQRRLDFVGEHLVWLPPLTLPPPAAEAVRASLDDIASTAAVALLLTRATAVQPATALNPNNVADIVEICRRLDGMPLALELAAAQFAMLSPAAIGERLQQRLGVLASGSAGREPRHQTLHALVDWSYGLLSAQEQRLLCWLGVFLQGWTIDAAEHFGRALGIDRDRLLELHAGLVLKSLVVVDPSLAPIRYRLLETVREFALDLLRARMEEADARTAHLMFFVQLAERSHRGMLEMRADEWLERMRHEHSNIDSALGWARSGGADPHSALRLVGALMLYGKCKGESWLLAGWVERALDGVAPDNSQAYVRALLCSGLFKLYVQHPATETHLAAAVMLAERLGDRWANGCASASLAMWHAHMAQLDQARNLAEIAADLAEAESDDWLRSLVGLARSWIAIGSGDHSGAVAILHPLRRVGYDLHQYQMIDIYLALSLYGLGQEQQAAAVFLDVVDLAVRTRNLRALAGAMEGTAYLALSAARLEASARLLGKAADIREHSRSPLYRFWVSYHDQAMSLLGDRIGNAVCDALCTAGAGARDEVVIEEARALLREVARRQGPPSSG